MSYVGRLNAVAIAPNSPSKDVPRLLCIGAHPDDSEAFASGLAALWSANGGLVCFLAMTDGTAGHYELGGAVLARRRQAEAHLAAAIVGADAVILDNQDGALMPTLENRHKVIRAIREFQPDVIATHRINDYHPDHRYTGVLVQDSCYMVMVPNVVPTIAPPAHEPIVMYMSDRFSKPSSLQPDVIFDIDSVIEQKLEAMIAHECQVQEWLPWMGGYLNQLPEDPQARRQFLLNHAEIGSADEANRFRDALVAKYGPERGGAARYAEAFELSEYAAGLDEKRMKVLFPF